MKFSSNLAILYGNITKDPELRYTQSGTPVCSFSVATNHSVKKADGSYDDVATFHNIVCWGKLAEWVSREYGKGHKVHVEGRIQNRSYENQSGEKKYVSEIVADMVTGERKEKPTYNRPANDEDPAEPDMSQNQEEVDTSDIPF